MSILAEILTHKRDELRIARERIPDGQLAELAGAVREPGRGFRAALRGAPPPRVVAEIKRRSPSRGEIRPDFDPIGCAKAYADAGAAAISILTDERYFGGHLESLTLVRGAVELPLLRKDFIIDPYQVDEARVAGADAILLITSALAPDELAALRRRAAARGLDALVEIHDEAQLEIALDAGADLVGINNRDLRSFEVDLGVTERLAGQVPPGVVVVAESGVVGNADLQRLERAGAHAVLVGETLMREPDVGLALRKLRGTS